ncbi:LCP family protein [Streptacidiphilus sp. NEAU-YB345]|uniref:LCP family protein n=1 Tax=Streptacidiphilus fuscans TaxID=2789292 RepID=A0A931B8W1_9ACTN|nr:LCP family protein [Streptacidiphilus fuscans]
MQQKPSSGGELSDGQGVEESGGHAAAHSHRASRRTSRRTNGPKRRRWKRILLWTSGTLAFLILVAAGGLYFYVQKLNSNIKKGALNNGGVVHAAPPKPDRFGRTPLNILLIGSDGRNNSQDCTLGGACDNSLPHADVEMLVHLSADRSNASVLSIPRDTSVEISACTDSSGVLHPAHRDIITDSLNYGPGCTVDTWEDLTHIHIDHYMMIDFSGVVQMADAIGGVSVCTKENVRDSEVYTDATGTHDIGSHLELSAGTHVITGQQALEWLRTRHAWGDGSDIGRTKAQHLYLNSMVRSMKSLNTLLDPLTVNKLAVAATKSLSVDTGLGSVNALADLALELNKVATDRITTVTMPWAQDPADPTAHLVPTQDAFTIFNMLVNDIPLDKNGPSTTGAQPTPTPTPTAAPTQPVDKATVAVTVQNDSQQTGRGRMMTDYLVAHGFSQATVDLNSGQSSTTTLTYPSSEKAQAQAVASALGLPAKALTASGSGSGSASGLKLVIGSDWTSGTNYLAANPLPSAGALPTSAVTQNAASDTNDCMDVNPAPYTSFAPGQPHYIYSWVGSTPPSN